MAKNNNIKKINFSRKVKTPLFGISKKDYMQKDQQKNTTPHQNMERKNKNQCQTKFQNPTKSNKDFYQDSNITTQNFLPIARVAIMGRPNVGKSSLFNRLNQKNIAITSPISGSTRDINKRNLCLQRFNISLVDTGGLELSITKLKSFYTKSNSSYATDSNMTHQHIEHINMYSRQDQDIHKYNLSNKKDQELIAKHLRENISHHSYQIITQSDIIIYIVDGNTPIASDEDIKIFRELNKQKPTILVLNKIDNDKIALNLSHFMSFGVEFFPISVSHNRGITKLLTHLEDIIESLIKAKKLKNPAISSSNTESLEPLELDFMDYFDNDASIIQFTKEKTQTNIFQHNKKSQSGQDSKEWQNDIDTNKFMCEESNIKEKTQQTISVGIIGRPNVGKSSLLNALTQQNRSLVSSIAGTTIDPVDESIFYKDYRITFIDTAGIRRRSKIDGIEKYALDRTQRILRQCDIALLVLDSSTDFVELDEKISSIASNNHLGLIVVFNKWDIRIKEFDEQMQIYKHKFKFLEYAPTLTISSITHKHIKELKQKILEVYSYFQFRIPTAQLNICIQNALKKHPIPSDHGKLVKIYYATQFDSKPPKIALMMNRPHALHFSYKRYLINILRQQFKFLGVPIIIEARSKKQSNDEEIE